MKKVISLLLMVCIVISMAGCVATEAPQQNATVNQQNNVQQKTTEKKPTETVLTVKNIAEYLTISSNVHDCETENVGGVWHGDGKLTIKTSPKKRGDFSNVVIKVAEDRTGKGWEDYATERTLEIPFDGKFEETFNISGYVFRGNFISDSPVVKLTIVSVSGKFIEQ